MDKKVKVLFLSRGTATRSKMAEGFFRELAGEEFHTTCAGTEAASVSPQAAEVMWEAGIDICTQEPSTVAALFRDRFHCVITLCDEKRERFALYPFTRRLIRWSVPDPEILAGEPEAGKKAFRLVREELRIRVEEFLETLEPRKTAVPLAQAARA